MTDFTESFNKADGAGLGPDLVWTLTGSGWATESNRGVINAVTAAEITARPDAADVGSADMFCELTLPDYGTSSYADVGLCVRTDAGMQNFWCLKRATASGGSPVWLLRKYIAGALTTVRQVDLALALPETWRLEAEGDQIRIYRNTVLLDTVTDAAIPTGQHGGLNGFRNSTASTRRVIFEDFKIGSLGAGGNTQLLPVAVEANAAQTVTGTKIAAIPVLMAQDNSLTLLGVKSAALPITLESSIASVLAGSKQFTLPVSQESTVVISLGAQDTELLPLATELSQALELSGYKTAILPVATEHTEALQLIQDTGVSHIHLGPGKTARAWMYVNGELVEVQHFLG